MPGVLSSDLPFTFSRVGKMASLMHTSSYSLLSEDDSTDLDEIANRILFGPTLSSSSQSSMNLSSAGSSPTGDNVDSDNDLLSDNEPSIDLLKYLDCQDFDSGLKCEGDCNKCNETPNKYNKYRTRQDPFMGIGGAGPSEDTSSTSPNLASLEQIWNPTDSEFDEYVQENILQQSGFSAWGHAPKTDEEPDLMLTKSSIASEEEIEDVSFPETPSPSSQSGTITGDDSDVDIETVTETPNASDSCGYITQDSNCSSPAGSPSPLHNVQNGSLMSILAKRNASSTLFGTQSTSSSKQVRFNSYGVSSSASLAENLMSGRHSLLGQKRKLSKDKKCVSKSLTQPAYTHILCSSNSVNFHDYAMSPGACTTSYSSLPAATETARPTVMSKRIYKRKQLALDASDKEKQHHHNQLERNRRQKLADLFVDLRDEVPKIANQPKASKVVILNESTVYIRELQELDTCQEELYSKELQKAEMLKKQLRHLKAQLSGSVK